MFDNRKEIKVMFEQFRTVDNVAELYTSSALENHALIVMNALDESIANLDDAEYLIDFLLTTGKSHQRFDNFSTSVFWVSMDYLDSNHTFILTSIVDFNSFSNFFNTQ